MQTSASDGSRARSASTPPPRQAATPSVKAALVRAFGRRKRLWIALSVGLLALVGMRAMESGASAATLEEAVAAVALRDGIRVDPDTVMWLEEDAGPLGWRETFFLGARERELPDLYYAEVRASSEHTVLDVAFLTPISHTASAAESGLVRAGDFVAYRSRVADAYDAVVVLDLRGEPDSLTRDWPGRARAQNRVSNLQETGRAAGFGVTRYQLLSPAAELALDAEDGRFVAVLPEGRLTIDPRRASAPSEGGELVEIQEQTKGMPGTVSWIVDTVRGLSFVGPEPIEWLENRVFAVKDALTRGYHGVFGAPDTAEEVAEELAMPEEVSEERIAMLTVTDPELGWPPAALDPVIDSPSVEGEGGWIPVVDDPYVNSYPNAPPAFYQTFLRADPERQYTRVYITLWDPRQVQLRIQSGVREPESATGQRGSGLIPREPEVLRRVVGAFNGGFQALHGEFGMMAEDRIYLPPKPWAATIAVFDDGRVGMGSWPAPNWRGRYYDEQLANRQIPEEMVDMRQNLTSVVEDGVFNPWQRWYWGAAPRQVEEQTYTTRSAMCLTQEGFLAYFWSQGIGPDTLGTAMIQARCTRSMHLDMNNPHCGFEFFHAYGPGETLPELSRRPRADSEFEGRLPFTDDWRVRMRRGVRSMGMPFPRYSDRDGRDFFYLTLKPLLPGPDLPIEGVSDEERRFSTEGLPHAGFPHAFARLGLGTEEARTWMVRIDPSRAVPEPIRRDDHTTPLAYLGGADVTAPSGGAALYAARRDVGWRFAVGVPDAEQPAIVWGTRLEDAPDAGAAIGVDVDGFLVYAERAGDPESLADRMRLAGVEHAIALGDGARLSFAVGDAAVGPDGYARDGFDRAGSVTLFAEERPAAEVMFPDNTPQPYSVWGYLQDQRVRYRRESSEEGPRFVRPPE
ncbi:MAG: hypothetical protein AB7S26_28860 [Sandaracinaceae bacterium]